MDLREVIASKKLIVQIFLERVNCMQHHCLGDFFRPPLPKKLQASLGEVARARHDIDRSLLHNFTHFPAALEFYQTFSINTTNTNTNSTRIHSFI